MSELGSRMRDKKSRTKVNANYKLHVISNTHWDREWVYPFQETRLLLLDFLDDLLDLLDKKPEFHSFLLDSQTIAVEDYLELRPEREEQVKEHVKSGPAHRWSLVFAAGRVHR